jgi:hypothetical protein
VAEVIGLPAQPDFSEEEEEDDDFEEDHEEEDGSDEDEGNGCHDRQAQ